MEAFLWELLELAEKIDTGLPASREDRSCFDRSERFGAVQEDPTLCEDLPSQNDLINIAMVAYSHTRGADMDYFRPMEWIMHTVSTLLIFCWSNMDSPAGERVEALLGRA